MTGPCGKYQQEVDRLEDEIETFNDLILFANSKEKEDRKARRDQAEKQLVQAKKDLQKCLNNPPKLPSGSRNINANNFTGALFLARPDSAGNVQGVAVMDLEVTQATGLLSAATWGRGAWATIVGPKKRRP